MLPDRLRLPVEIDPAPLLTEAESLPDEAWIPHMVRQNYEGDWAAAPLMAPAGETHPIRQIYPDPTATRFVPTKFLDAMPATRALLAALPCETQCVRLMRLGPGAWIKPHRDHDLDAALGHARLHLPLATGPDVDFRLTGERVTMAAGELWYLRLSDTHEVNNRGSGPRLHLVIDVIANDWLVGALEAAGL
jgi:hypothetical protein